MKIGKKFIVSFLVFLFALTFVSCKKEGGTGDGSEGKEEGKIIYASPTGVESNSGTKESPLDGASAAVLANAGETVLFAEGTYEFSLPIYLSKIGTSNKPITLKPEVEGSKVVFDFSEMDFLSTNRGVTLSGNYYNIYGLEIKGAGDNGMYVSGSYNVVENCVFHDNRDTGLQIGRGGSSMVNMDEWPCNNLIKNCTSYNNFDDQTGGENADGFAAKLTVGYGNVFDGCIAYRNADDGWDLFAKQDSGNIGRVILYNCVSFENGFLYTKMSEKNTSNEPITEPSYRTTLGDGIGFKLGGSIMKGDVELYNCIAFNNRLHGVGDNSNPGIISVYNTTTYNNSAVIDETTGKIDSSLSIPEGDSVSTNFNLARTEDSYNVFSGLLSYASNNSVGTDAFRGTMNNSLLNVGKEKYNIFEGYSDASSYVSEKSGVLYEEGLSDESFVSVEAPSGLENPNIHSELRNEDGSINLGDFLVLKDENLKVLNDGSPIGATLNKNSWNEYEHYDLEVNGDLDEDHAILEGAKKALSLTCDPNAIYQDFLLPTRLNATDVIWYSSNPNVLSIGQEDIISNSGSTERLVTVNRDRNSDVKVTLTAKLIYNRVILNDDGLTYTILNTVSTEKTFEVTVKKASPELGSIKIGDDVEKIILDKYEQFTLEKVAVTNSSDYNGKLLVEGQDYDLNVSYTYRINKNAQGIEVSNVYTSTPGIYTVTFEAISKLNPNVKTTKSYDVYVVDPDAKVSFVTQPNVYINRDGFLVSGELDNVNANMYVYTSGNSVEDVDTIISKGEKFYITDDLVSVQATNSNENGYYIHMVVTNVKETEKSAITSIKVDVKDITTKEEFYNLMSNGSSSPVIYSLKADLDFSGFNWTPNSGTKKFSSLFNGNGHTISNISIANSKDTLSIFNQLDGGTIMNVNFVNIDLQSTTGERVGIVGRMSGGYIHNVKISGINISANKRIGGLVGHITSGDNYITQVSLHNEETDIITGVNTTSGQDIGGLVGFVQNDSSVTDMSVNISNSVVYTTLGSGSNRYCGGFIGRVDDRISGMEINIDHCIYDGKILVDNYGGGIMSFTSGIGKITVKNSAANVKIYKQGNLIVACEKNNSSIMGRYAINSGTGQTNVELCYGNIGEYNSQDSVGTYDVTQVASEFFGPDKEKMSVITELTQIDIVNIWDIKEISGRYVFVLR